MRTQDHEEWREEAYARDELNIRANAPSPLLPKSSVQKGGAYFRELTVHVIVECSLLQDFIYPENVAYPIGGPGAARFLVMEMHYDNPNGQRGTYTWKHKDFSSIRKHTPVQSCSFVPFQN